MTVPVQEVENSQILWVKVNTDRHDNERLWTFTGTALLNWRASDDEHWQEDDAHISMRMVRGAPAIRPEQWIDATAAASPTQVRFVETIARDQVGWGVESATPYRPTGDFHEEYGVNVRLVLVGNDITLYRVTFQLNVLTRDVG